MKFNNGRGRKNNRIYEIRYDFQADGYDHEKRYYIYRYPAGFVEELNTYGLVHFATQEEAEAFCNGLANGEINEQSLYDGMKTVTLHQQWQEITQKIEHLQEQLHGMGISYEQFTELLQLWQECINDVQKMLLEQRTMKLSTEQEKQEKSQKHRK